MLTVDKNVRCLILTIAALWVAPVHGTEAPSNWRCEKCLVDEGWDLDLAFGPGYVTDDAYRFGDYTGLDGRGVYLFGDFSGSYRDADAHYFSFDGFTLSPDAGAIFMKGGRQGRYEIRGSYRSIPRRFFDSTATPFDGNGSDLLSLPENWIRASTTSGMSALPDTLEPVEVRRDWEVLRFGIDIQPESRWDIRADYARTEREGRTLDAGSFLFSAAERTSPVDYTTDDLELAVAYAADNWQTSVSYFGSYFENGNSSLSWDNPYTGQPGADAGETALAPDNESHQIAFAGSMVLPKRTILSGQLAFGSLSQDEELLPYTTNQLISASALPATSAGAEADTMNLNLRVVSTPWRRTTLQAQLKFNDFDNRTPIEVYDYVVTDSVPAGIPVANLTYDYERTDLKLRGEFRATSRLKLHLGYDTRSFSRNFQDRSRTDTDRLWFRLRHRLGDGADVDLDLFKERRSGSSYDVLDNPAAQSNPLMRKYNLSDRDRYGIRLKGSLYPFERWDFGWDFEYGEDDYEDSVVGLTSTSHVRLGGDMNWLVTDEASLFVSGYTESVEVAQAGSQSFSQPDWAATTKDDFDSVSLGFDHPGLIGPVGVRLEYGLSRSTGRVGNNTSGLVTRFPDLRSKRETVGLGFRYDLNDNWRFGLDYYYEKVESDDWALNDVGPATITNLLSMGADPFNYDVSVIYFSVRYLK